MTTRKPGVEEEPAPFEKDGAEPAIGTIPRTAQPKSGPIDLKAMHEEIARDFPKTLARLAE